MNQLDKERFAVFTRELLNEYNNSNRIIEILNNCIHTVEDTASDNDFIKIGLRPQLERKIFEEQTGDVYTHPYVIGLGTSVALGEIRYFVKKLEEYPNISKINVKKDELNPKLIKARLDSTLNQIIVSSEDFYDFAINKEWFKYFDFGEGVGVTRFNDTPWYIISSKTLGHAIWILAKSDINWTYKLFYNEYTKEKEKLFIKISDKGTKVDVLFYSSVRFYIKEGSKIYNIQLD